MPTASAAVASAAASAVAAAPAGLSTPVELLVLAQALAFLGFGFGLWQYSKAQAWKRLEFAASVLDRLRTDPTLRLALFFLDWKARMLFLPKELADYGHDGAKFEHSIERMATAYAMESRSRIAETDDYELKPEFTTPQYLLYIDVLDRFFEYLGQVQAFLELGVLETKDIRALGYWVNRLGTLKHNGQSVFMPYLQHHEQNVLRLMAAIDLCFEAHPHTAAQSVA